MGLVSLGVVILVMVIGAISAVGYVVHLANRAPNISTLHPDVAGGTSQVFAADGTRLGFIQANNLREAIGWSAIPTNLKNATVAIEDQRFYSNNGIDLQGVVRAAIRDASTGQRLQGGSTLTMQLVRNLYLGDPRSFKAKLFEAKMAMDYEKQHNKQYILTRYLNSVPYGTVGGQTAIGVEAASRTFFNKSANRLSLAQAALLAGLPQAPSDYNPFSNPSAATARRNSVLAKMAQLHYITPALAARTQRLPLETHHGNYFAQRREDYFLDYVQQQLVSYYGVNTVQQGGLKIYTTIDLKYQNQARNAIATELNQPGDPAAAVVTINPKNGYVQAMAQSATYDQSKFNLAVQGLRQPGSTFKAVVLADALSRGVNPDSTYYVSHTLDKGWLPIVPDYMVQTFEKTSSNKPENLVDATLHSDNTVFAQLAADLGEQSITQMAYRLGVVEHLDSYPAEALGGLTHGVSPLEMANVFATLADGGWRNKPISITRVTFPGGHQDTHWGVPSRVHVLSDSITAEETKILNMNVQSGTATRSAIGCPSAAKTGTTNDLIDAWLDGYTPNFSTVVWIGYPKQRVSMTDVHGQPQQGGYIPAQIWHDYMSQVAGASNCPSFPAASAPIQYQPFSGTYVSGGHGGSSSSGSGSGSSGSFSVGGGSGSGSSAPNPGPGTGPGTGTGGHGAKPGGGPAHGGRPGASAPSGGSPGGAATGGALSPGH